MIDEIKNIIERTIAGIQVKEELGTLVPPMAMILIFKAEGILFGNGKAKVRGNDVQIDLYYKSKTKLVNDTQLLVLELENKYRYVEYDIYYDTTARLQRTTIKFTVMKGV